MQPTNPARPVRLGAYVSKKTLFDAFKKDLRPEKRHEAFNALKKVGISSKSVGKVTLTEAKKIVGQVKDNDYLKAQIENIGTYHSSDTHVLKTLVQQAAGGDGGGVKEAIEQEKQNMIKARFKRAENRMGNERASRQMTMHQQKALASREATRKRNIEAVKTEDRIKAGEEDLSAYSGTPKPVAGPLTPSFGHLAPQTSKPGQMTDSKNSDKDKDKEKSKPKLMDMNIG